MSERGLILASRNPGKLREVQAIMSPRGFEVTPIDEIATFDGQDVEETGTTFLANSLIKARWAAELSGQAAVADDSGLEVDALDGAPGVYSARYAGAQGDDEANNRKLITELSALPDDTDWSARFRCVVVLFVPESDEVVAELVRSVSEGSEPRSDDEMVLNELVRLEGGWALASSGTIEGVIVTEPRGAGGFGYDPHFFVPHLGSTTAELPAMQKNAISHRGKAFRQLASMLGELG